EEQMSKLLLGIVIAAGLIHLGLAVAEHHGDRGDDDDNDGGDKHILAVRHAVPHISTVPANAGEQVELFAWERVGARNAEKFEREAPTGKVVLFVHGGSVPSVPGFDLDYKDYSWMESLARAG